MKRHLILPLTAAALALTGGVASAHIPNVSDNCQGLNVALTNYEGGATNNQVVVTIDGAAQTFTFGGSFTKTFAWSTSSAHTWTVTIDANRLNGHPTQYDKTFNGSEQPCTVPTSTLPTTTTTTTPAPTTTTPTPTTTSGPTTSTSEPSTTTSPSTTQPSTSSTVEVGEPPIPSSIPTIPPNTQPTAPPASVADPILPVTGPSGTARLLIVACALLAAGVLLAHTARRP